MYIHASSNDKFQLPIVRWTTQCKTHPPYNTLWFSKKVDQQVLFLSQSSSSERLNCGSAEFERSQPKLKSISIPNCGSKVIISLIIIVQSLFETFFFLYFLSAHKIMHRNSLISSFKLFEKIPPHNGAPSLLHQLPSNCHASQVTKNSQQLEVKWLEKFNHLLSHFSPQNVCFTN